MAIEARTPEGELIGTEIERAGMSFRAVAREVPISDTQLRYWVRGTDHRGNEVAFPSRQLARVAQVLGVTPDQLLTVERADAADILRGMRPAVIKNYTPEELGRLIEGMAKRIGELEDEVDELKGRVDESEGLM